MTVAGDYAYVTGDGLHILDLSDPTQPQVVSHLEMPGYPLRNILVSGDHAYVSQVFCEFGCGGSSIRILDVRDLAQPVEVGAWSTRTTIEDLALYGDIVYLASWQRGLEAVNVHDPAAPSTLGAYGTLGEVIDVVVDGNRFAFVSDGAESGLRVLDLAPALAERVWPVLRGTAEMRWVNGYTVQNGLAYVPVWGEGLRIVDTSDPDAPQERSVLEVGTGAQAVVAGNVAYVSIYDGLVLVDVSDPAAPHKLSTFSVQGSAAGLAVREGIAYLAVEDVSGSDTGTLYLIDVDNPREPLSTAAIGTEGRGLRVALAGDFAYIAVLDWSSISPRGGVQVVDTSDPTQPQTIAYLALPGGSFDIQTDGNVAFVAAGEAGVYAVDLTDPANPRLVGHLDTPGSARRVFIVDDQICIADGAGGLIVARVYR